MLQKIFVITETNRYGEEAIVGACSSKEKADLVIEAEKYCSFGNFGVHIEELEIDGIIKDIIRDLGQELEHYDKFKAFLDKPKES